MSSIEQSKDILNLGIQDSTQVRIMKIDDGSSFMELIIEKGEEKIKFETKNFEKIEKDDFI